jgi:hypothetical protein
LGFKEKARFQIVPLEQRIYRGISNRGKSLLR